MSEQNRRRRVAIVGGGIAGLAAGFFLRDRGAEVTVLEGSPRLGGKLAVSEVAGIAVDAGAEALLARLPEGVDLIRAVGLAGAGLPGYHRRPASGPGVSSASLPKRQFMGVPADFGELEQSRDPLTRRTGPGPPGRRVAGHRTRR